MGPDRIEVKLEDILPRGDDIHLDPCELYHYMKSMVELLTYVAQESS